MLSRRAGAAAVHAELYKKALAAVQAGRDRTETGFCLCPVCGRIEVGRPAGPGPICHTGPEKFVQV